MAPIPCHGWLRRPPSSASQLPSSTPSLRSGYGLVVEARVDVNREVRGLRMKMKRQNGKGGSAGCGDAVIKHSPHLFAFKSFWETIPAICASPNSPQQQGGPLPGLSRNHGPYLPFITAIGYYSPNIRRHLHQPLRLSNYYCTAITLVFSS